MKDDSDNWSNGQLQIAATFVETSELDCSDWDSESSAVDWTEGTLQSAALPITPGKAADFVEGAAHSEIGSIGDDAALAATRQRITNVLDTLAQLRANTRPEEFSRVSRSYRTEVERLQRAVLDYLTRPSMNAG